MGVQKFVLTNGMALHDARGVEVMNTTGQTITIEITIPPKKKWMFNFEKYMNDVFVQTGLPMTRGNVREHLEWAENHSKDAFFNKPAIAKWYDEVDA